MARRGRPVSDPLPPPPPLSFRAAAIPSDPHCESTLADRCSPIEMRECVSRHDDDDGVKGETAGTARLRLRLRLRVALDHCELARAHF